MGVILMALPKGASHKPAASVVADGDSLPAHVVISDLLVCFIELGSAM